MFVLRGGAVVARWTHNPKVGGSNPFPATKFNQNRFYMKQKIKEALQQAYKNLGLNEEAFDGVAAFGETIGTTEDTLANFVKGAVSLLKREQSNADKVRNANAESKKQVEELKAKLAEAEAKMNGGKPQEAPDYAKLISEAVTAAVQPFKDELAALKGAKSAEDAFNTAKTAFYGNDYAKKYTDERDYAWERAVEINEATGKKMTAEELQEKAMGYFNKAVAKKGVDTSKPFESEGEGKTIDFSETKAYLQKEGLIPQDEK